MGWSCQGDGLHVFEVRANPQTGKDLGGRPDDLLFGLRGMRGTAHDRDGNPVQRGVPELHLPDFIARELRERSLDMDHHDPFSRRAWDEVNDLVEHLLQHGKLASAGAGCGGEDSQVAREVTDQWVNVVLQTVRTISPASPGPTGRPSRKISTMKRSALTQLPQTQPARRNFSYKGKPYTNYLLVVSVATPKGPGSGRSAL